MPSSPLAHHSYAVAARELMQQSLRAGGALRLSVVGTSMLPLLRPGAAIWLEAADPSRLRRGDLVVIWQDGVLLTHRLVAIDSSGWHTKGDNNRLIDPPVAAAAIQGRIVTLELGGALISMRQHPWPLVNRLLGRLSWLEARLVPLIPHRQRSIDRYRLASYGTHLLFRLLMRAIVIVAVR